ncbi:MAG: SoxR reducing system RseC family protein [Bacteroidales bacterium]|nr:SoxR reducing system RseC family protein [Bacteroidales bacterium]
MADYKNIISHKGIINNIDNNKIYISIISQSACASCHVKGMCSVADMKEKIIEIENTKNNNYKIGDTVTVVMEKSSGTKAVVLGYFIPFIILLISLIVLISITNNEGLSGLISIGILIPYYLILYIFRDKLKKIFVFKLG